MKNDQAAGCPESQSLILLSRNYFHGSTFRKKIDFKISAAQYPFNIESCESFYLMRPTNNSPKKNLYTINIGETFVSDFV